jgi:antitoxin component YwqK of YwqJK toxin-antitoxin module
LVVQQEAYVYLDSVDRLQETMRKYMDLDYALWSRIKPASLSDSLLESRLVQVLYDSNGREIVDGRVAYSRLGIRDSLGRWDGPVREYDRDGRLTVKGHYRRNKRDGVFLFYSPDGVCVEAGRYLDGKKFGKWQTFHSNGRIASEVFYNNGYFVRSVWDSVGNQLVVDGNGRETQLYPDDVIKVDGEYRHGLKEGTWYGRYRNGDMHYEENFVQGRLISGQARNPAGETFVYDESSLFPIPEGGFERFQTYLKAETKKFKTDDMGHVKLSFRVTRHGTLTDLTVDKGATPALDAKAKEIIVKGPRWRPARRHGYEPIGEWVFVQVEFY